MHSPQNQRYNRSADSRLCLLGSAIISNDCSTLIECGVQGTTSEYHVNWEYKLDGSHLYKCNCPDFQRRNSACKHIYFIFCRVLKFERKDLGNVSILDMFIAYGRYKQEIINRTIQTSGAVIRKSFHDDDECPICFETLTKNDTVWCKTTCGNNIHTHCMERWKQLGNDLCPLCRSDWIE